MPPLLVVKRSNRFRRNETELQLRKLYKGGCYMWFCGEDLSQNAYSLDGCPPKPSRRALRSNPAFASRSLESIRDTTGTRLNTVAKYTEVRHSHRLGRRNDEGQRTDLISDFRHGESVLWRI